MELGWTNADYSVIQTLEQLNRKDKNHYLTDTYEAMLSQKTIRALFDKLKFNLSLEEIILNTYWLAKYMIDENQILAFVVKPIVIRKLFETQFVRNKILTKSYRELGLNKSTLCYQRRRLERTGTFRLYNKTRRFFVIP